MYKVYYEINNTPYVKDYKSLKRALRFAFKQEKNPDTDWLDISNQGPEQDWYNTYVPGSNFKWHNGQSFQLAELPDWMRVEETA